MHTLPVVILTREAGDNRAVAARLISEGYSVVEYPCISVCMRPVDAISGKVADFNDYAVLIFTSKRGVMGVAHMADAIRETRADIAVIGSGTAQHLIDITGRQANIMPKEATGEATARALIDAYPRGTKMLYLRGDMTTGTMADMLDDSGMDLHDVVVYENIAPQLQPLFPEGPAIAVFASPSAVHRFFEANPHLAAIPCVAIGPVTADELKRRGISEIYVSKGTDTSAIVDCVQHTASQGETI